MATPAGNLGSSGGIYLMMDQIDGLSEGMDVGPCGLEPDDVH